MKWLTIVGYEQYMVSDTGIIKNTLTGKALKPFDNGHGYKKVTLCKNGKKKKEYVHRIVALAFVDGYKEGYTVDHIDMNKENNQADNLKWMSLEDNVKNMHIAYNHKTN